MAKTLYKADFDDTLPLGGIGTGHINLGSDGSLSADLSALFAIKAEKDGSLFDARIMQSTKNKELPLSCFEKSSAKSFFPFAEITFCDSSFPADINMTAFSPFIPLNDTDSGIPAVVFEFEITNTSKEKLDYSIACVSKNINKTVLNKMGCTDTGEAYIYLSENCEEPKNTCIATNSKNVSFCEYLSSFHDFSKNFTQNTTLINEPVPEHENSFPYGALCTHFCLSAGETQRLSFCISWYEPKNEFSRNYYAQYFESSLECASYIYRQTDRLYSASREFCNHVLGATLPEHILDEVNTDLFNFSKENRLRLSDGALITDKKQEFSDIDSFISRCGILESLFPELDYSELDRFYKSSAYETCGNDERLIAVLKSFRRYTLCGNIDTLIEDWYYIVKCIELVYGDDLIKQCKVSASLQEASISSAVSMAEAVKDKKRVESYSRLLDNLPLGQFSMDIAKGFSKINEMSGFRYNAKDKHISFSPRSDSCPLDSQNTFRCFFCTPQCFGYVEEGIDYIEINILSGTLLIRSFGVPRVPRLVQYGGRNWKFENKNLTAFLDSDLEITPKKKLTILIDIKQ